MGKDTMITVTGLRRQLLRIQKESYRRKLREARLTLEASPAVTRYGREYQRSVRSYSAISSWPEVMRKVAAADVIYHGDYHPLRHSQRCILAMLQEASEKRSLVLCLEMFHGADQKWVDLYMAGEMEEKDFLRRIRYAEKWTYNWNPWKRILDFCRERRVPVLGINFETGNPETSLAERDAYSARVIGQALIRHTGSLVYVVDGDFHVAPGHLPAEVAKRVAPLGLNPGKVILHQNAENLYWKLAKEGHEEAEVLQIGEDSFCLMNTMPTTKLQAYLDWLHYAEEGEYRVRGNWAELSGEDYLAQIHSIVKDLDRLMGFGFPQEKLSRLTVYSNRNLDFAQVIALHPAIKTELPRIEGKIHRGEGFLLEIQDSGEPAYVIYLQAANINQAAEEATHFVNCVLRGPLSRSLSSADRFYREAMTEALGFFGSKMINERRKAVSEWSLRNFLGQARKDEGGGRDRARMARVGRFLLQHHHLERREAAFGVFRRKFGPLFAARGGLPHAAATQLGYMLGSKLFYAVKKGYLPLVLIRDLFRRSFEHPGEAFGVYMDLSRRLQRLHTDHGRASLEAERSLSAA